MSAINTADEYSGYSMVPNCHDSKSAVGYEQVKALVKGGACHKQRRQLPPSSLRSWEKVCLRGGGGRGWGFGGSDERQKGG